MRFGIILAMRKQTLPVITVTCALSSFWLSIFDPGHGSYVWHRLPILANFPRFSSSQRHWLAPEHCFNIRWPGPKFAWFLNTSLGGVFPEQGKERQVELLVFNNKQGKPSGPFPLTERQPGCIQEEELTGSSSRLSKAFKTILSWWDSSVGVVSGRT